MTWEETIQYIRTKPEYAELVEKAYFEENLELNVERFKNSEEYAETKKLLLQFKPDAQTILDIGSGNGISAVAFSLDGFSVTVSEPDPSNTIGAGAIQWLKAYYHLADLSVYQEFAENINFEEKRFDVVYIRQAMHHAYDLDKFICNLATYLKPGGILMTVRDHVIYNEDDRKWFLENHPLQKFYGGENAFSESEYIRAFEKAGLTLQLRLKHFDSVINYFPVSSSEFINAPGRAEQQLKTSLRKRIGVLSSFKPVFDLYRRRNQFQKEKYWDEKKIPGRMYSFIAIKN